MRKIASISAVVLGTLIVLALVWLFRTAFVMFVLSLFVAAATRPPIESLVKRGVNQRYAILTVYLAGVLVFGSLFFLIGDSLATDLQNATNDFNRAYRSIKNEWPNGTLFQQTIAGGLPDINVFFDDLFEGRNMELVQALLGFATDFINITANAVIVIVLSMYWSADRVSFERLWLSLLPAGRRAYARDIWRDIEARVGAYLRSELVQVILAGIALGLGYRLMDLPYPTLVAVTGTLFWLIPWLGGVLAIIFPLLIGLTVGPALTALATLYTFLVFVILETVVEPRFFDRKRFNSLILVVTMLAMADALGLFGLLVAVPIAAAVQIFLEYQIKPAFPGDRMETARQILDLEARAIEIDRLIAESEASPPEIVNLNQRLHRLVREARQTIRTDSESV